MFPGNETNDGPATSPQDRRRADLPGVIGRSVFVDDLTWRSTSSSGVAKASAQLVSPQRFVRASVTGGDGPGAAIAQQKGSSTVRYLVVIDHTLGGTGLASAVREHAFEEGDIQVDVIVPCEQSETDTAQRRLEMELQRLGAEGIAASGSVVQADPYEGISDAAGRQKYDGIIIATHPTTVSRWVHLDLPRRVERELQIPIEWIDAHTDDPSEETEINIELPRTALDDEDSAPLT